MESYGLNRLNRGLCWFAITVSLIGLAGTTGTSIFLIFRQVSGVRSAEQSLAFGCSLLLGCVLVSLMREAVKMLRYQVVLLEEGVRVGDILLLWKEIDGIKHPRGTVGLAFRLLTWDGRTVDVYSGVENARQVEQIVADRAFMSRQ